MVNRNLNAGFLISAFTIGLISGCSLAPDAWSTGNTDQPEQLPGIVLPDPAGPPKNIPPESTSILTSKPEPSPANPESAPQQAAGRVSADTEHGNIPGMPTTTPAIPGNTFQTKGRPIR